MMLQPPGGVANANSFRPSVQLASLKKKQFKQIAMGNLQKKPINNKAWPENPPYPFIDCGFRIVNFQPAMLPECTITCVPSPDASVAHLDPHGTFLLVTDAPRTVHSLAQLLMLGISMLAIHLGVWRALLPNSRG